MSQQWKKSQVPYFITVKDQGVTFQSTNPTNLDTTIESSTNNSASIRIGGSKPSYPQVKFLFEDDPPLEPHLLNDDDIILELDATGSRVMSHSVGNGEVYQITGDVEISSGAEDETKNIKCVTINRISTHVDGMDELIRNVSLNLNGDHLDHLRNLVDVFNQRNQLLLGCLR